MKITAHMLVDKGACSEQVDLFRGHFPDGATVSIKTCVSVASVFDWDWAADNLLAPAQRKAYDEAMAPARKAFYEATAAAWKAYYEATAPDWKAYYEATGGARKAYDEAMAQAFARAWKGLPQ